MRDLGLDWRLGAAHFESWLVDHDVCSNYGEWSSMAGVARHPSVRTPLGIKGRGPSAGSRGKRGDRAGDPWAKGAGGGGFSVFEPAQQSAQYDRDGSYVRQWCEGAGGAPAAARSTAAGRAGAQGSAAGGGSRFEAFQFRANIATILQHHQQRIGLDRAPAFDAAPGVVSASGSTGGALCGGDHACVAAGTGAAAVAPAKKASRPRAGPDKRTNSRRRRNHQRLQGDRFS